MPDRILFSSIVTFTQVMPGDNTTVNVNLIYPTVLSEGLRFAVREGGRTVAAGVVAKLVK